MKPRKKPHPSLFPSVAETFDGFNTLAYNALIGEYQKIGMGWYQRRLSTAGVTFKIRAHGDFSVNLFARWIALEPLLDAYVSLALANMTEPWEAPEALELDELILDSVHFGYNNIIELSFRGAYCRIYHEAPVAKFIDGKLEQIEWIT